MGLAWLFRRRRSTAPAPAAVDPAEELKRKLAESRTDAPEPGAAPSEPADERPSLEERRRAVHEKAVQAIEAMRGGDQPPPADPE